MNILGHPPYNTAVGFIVNDERPTNRTRHVDVQFFAVQQWRQKGYIKAQRLAGPINPADSMTKPTPFSTYALHTRYIMGEFRLPSDPLYKESKTPISSSLELGEGVRSESKGVIENGEQREHPPGGSRDAHKFFKSDVA
jgi:hypothetical protein